MKEKIEVIAKVQFEATHYWSDAPNNVVYLRRPHRHMFYVTVWMPVMHDDRDVEVITLKHDVELICKSLVTSIAKQGWSCERIALEIAKSLDATYMCKYYRVEVLEDNENGGIITYERI